MQDINWLDVLGKSLDIAVSVCTIGKLLGVNSNSSAYAAPCASSFAYGIASSANST